MGFRVYARGMRWAWRPRVVALERMAQGAEEVATWAQETAERSERHPDVRPGDWVVLGRVIAADGKAAAGLVVKIIDQGQKFAKRLGQTSTDSQGELFLGYHAEEFADLCRRVCRSIQSQSRSFSDGAGCLRKGPFHITGSVSRRTGACGTV
jgi:hypothetical protein